MPTKDAETETVEPEVIVIEPEAEPFTHAATEHPLLDVDYDGSPATAGLDYPAPGALEEEEPEVAPTKSATKAEPKSERGL